MKITGLKRKYPLKTGQKAPPRSKFDGTTGHDEIKGTIPFRTGRIVTLGDARLRTIDFGPTFLL